jgi:hypothetical protein
LNQRAVKVGPSIAEKAPSRAVAGQKVEIDRAHGHSLVIAA